MATWITADQHFRHHNIIRFCDRPFASIDEMDARMITEWSSRVGKGDDVYVLGDLIGGKVDEEGKSTIRRTFAALPGRKHLIWGNHDKPWVHQLPWASIQQSLDIIIDDQRVYMHHYPMLTWPGSRFGSIHLFGHVHNNWLGSRNAVNVGVDCWDFQPIQISDIVERAKSLPINPLWDILEPGCEL